MTSDNDQPPSAPAPAGRNTGPNAEQASQPVEMTAESPPVEAAPNTASGDAAASGELEASDRPPSDESPAAPPSSPPRRNSLLRAATAGGGLVLAVIGLASLFLSRDHGVSDLEARLAAVEQQVRNPAAAAPAARAPDDVTSRLAKLEAAGAGGTSAAGDSALADRIGALQGEVKALAETVGMLGRRNDEALAAAREARSRAEATAAATAAAVAALTQKVASAPAVDRGELDSKFDTLGNRVAGLERNDKALASELAKRAAAETAGDRAVRLALAAAALRTAVERGDPYASELATVKALPRKRNTVRLTPSTATEPFSTRKGARAFGDSKR